MKTKECKRCSEIKLESDFVKCTLTKSGYRAICKTCNNQYYAKRRIDKYEQVRSYEKKFHRQRRLKYEYNITEDQLDNLYLNQQNHCAICKQEKKLVIDHCHTNGNVRGLLCSKCNLGLGHFKDNTEYLEAAIKYLNENSIT